MIRIHKEIDRFLRTGVGDFDALALELFAYQFEFNAPYQAYCRAQDRTPATVGHWSQIPAVPVSAFKSVELATFPVGRAAAVFYSSTTTGQRPSRHFFRTLSYYETSLKRGFERWVMADSPGERFPLALLVPSPGEAPHSSLTWMLEVVRRKWGTGQSRYFIERGSLEEDCLASWLDAAQRSGEPVALLGTTLAFLEFFDLCAKGSRVFQLPPGSRLMDTGGMKTQKREVSRGQFVGAVVRFLGIPEARCVNEYGMCELSSQFYAPGRSAVLQGPAWVHVRVIDQETGTPAAGDRSGLLRFFDLANVDSVLAVQTDDVGTLKDGGFVFQGRAPGAELKGCSLSAEALLHSSPE
jgi:hypothetical protein